MSIVVRKRTSSFSSPSFDSNPRPAKVPRMGSLRRSESMLVLPQMHAHSPALALHNNALSAHIPLPYIRTLQYYKEQRLRRKALLNQNQDSFTFTIRTIPGPVPVPQQQPQQVQPNPYAPRATSSAVPPTPRTRKPSTSTVKRSPPAPKPPAQVILPSAASPVTQHLTLRTTSPLSGFPVRTTLRPSTPPRARPKSKAEPDLYKTAIKMRMQCTPEGQRILHLGPRLAMEIMEATKDIVKVTNDLERLVNDVEEREDLDVVMADATMDALLSPSTTTTNNTPSFSPAPTTLCGSVAPPVLTASWVMVKGDDWEMVDCAA